MTGKEYESLAMRTNDGYSMDRLLEKAQIQYDHRVPWDLGGVLNGCLGLAGEAGEFNDMIKKWIFHEKKLDVDHAMKELGDVLWYVAMICHSFGWSMDEVMQLNVDKLKARYPEGFDPELSQNRAADDV